MGKIKKILAETDAAKNKFDVRNLFGGKKDGEEDKDADALTKKIKRVQDEAKKAIGALGATFGDNNIDFSIDRIKTNISKLSDIPAPRMQHILTEVEMVKDRIKSLAAPIQAEKLKLDAILSSDLKTINPDKFLADTLEITTRIQEMTRPIRTEIESINALDPRLKAVDTDFFDESLVNAVNTARTQIDNVRGIVGEVHKVPVIKLPNIDINPVKRAMSAIEKLGQTISDSFRTNLKGIITGTTSLRDALGNVLDQVANKIADFAIDSLFSGLAGAFGGGGGGGILGSFFQGVFSFDGGGFTGKGSRSGGVDGKGGFPAILHPNETVVDHTRTKRNPNRGDLSAIGTGYNTSPQTSSPMITSNNYFNGVTREEIMRDIEAKDKQMMREFDASLPGKINRHNFNRNRGVA